MLTLNRPQRHNAFTPAGYRTLAESLRAAAADDEVHVVMLSGAGPGFCSGVDLAALSHAGSDLAAFDTAFHALLDALTTFPKPLLAAVHGSAVGFGFTILLHCDVVLVADDARMSAPFAALGTTRHSADEAVGLGFGGPRCSASGAGRRGTTAGAVDRGSAAGSRVRGQAAVATGS